MPCRTGCERPGLATLHQAVSDDLWNECDSLPPTTKECVRGVDDEDRSTETLTLILNKMTTKMALISDGDQDCDPDVDLE